MGEYQVNHCPSCNGTSKSRMDNGWSYCPNCEGWFKHAFIPKELTRDNIK